MLLWHKTPAFYYSIQIYDEGEWLMYNLLKEDYVRCVWPGAVLPLGESGKYLVRYFKENYDVRIEYLEQAKTLPSYGENGGRIDQIFNVFLERIEKFKKIKNKIWTEYEKITVRAG